MGHYNQWSQCTTLSAVGQEVVRLMETFSSLNQYRYFFESRHIATQHRYISAELLTNGVISIEHIRLKAMLANPFVKGLATKMIGIVSRG